MPGELSQPKPSRSDEIVSLDQQLETAQQTRQLFQSCEPVRPLKPSRSDCSDGELPPCQTTALDLEIPEHRKFQELEAARSEPVLNGSGTPSLEEFVETQYYNDLNSVDKTQHHTTGTGFIHIETDAAVGLNVAPSGLVRTSSNCNPATNEWIPSPEVVFPLSDKPHRSEP